ncbi:choline ABC transporter permease subunit [Oceanibacterium hippocampi]|uniref:Glycine betaine transport system permease protein OpuAB n=1 Tax=Oceanibacterium hippocampi TaxID=745714 RepID=A0A1Y5SBC5_9PROT|nr:choline ABC transporter permease subunit [Oceanibacterium hippocampi]SLN36827.1 Glycine betaine transport system permease protein OpuAB [Oceanibacterium hippocampi]
MEWLTSHKIPLGRWIEDGVDVVYEHSFWFFDAISTGLGFVIEGLIAILLWLPALLLIAMIAGLAFALHRNWRLPLLIVPALLLVANMGYWEEMVETIALVLTSTAVCVLIGVPLGIAAAHRPWFQAGLRPVLDLMQTIPTFVYLIPTMVFFGLGVVPGLISTVVFAMPAPIRLTYLGVSGVPRELIEAGEAFGATPGQLLRKVELPYAMPAIMTGITQCIMLSLSMVVIAALVGADGLGKEVVRALNSADIARGFESGLAIVIVAILLDRICKRADPGAGGR